MLSRTDMSVAIAVKPAVEGPIEHEPLSSNRTECTDCSHCAHRSRGRTEAGVRVSVNLRQFFSDQRAHAFMWAPFSRCVEWLVRRIAHVFGLPDDIVLMSRGHILPVNEPLLILDRDDPIEVVNKLYVFTPDNKSNESVVTSKKTAIEAIRLIEPLEPNGCREQSNLIREDMATSQSDYSACENISRVAYNPAEDKNMPSSQEMIDEGQDLQQLKQHALRLLDEHCHMLQDSSPPKRIRRRRRRRKLQPTADRLDASDAEEPHTNVAATTPQDTAVLRNGIGSRPPRLVHALSPTPVPEYAV